jgi:hypothetical protein
MTDPVGLTRLQAVNVLVDDDTRCVISDFGQSEIKSEVYRLSRVPIPRESGPSLYALL